MAEANSLQVVAKEKTNLLERLKPEIVKAAPKFLNPDRMLRIALTEFRKDPRLFRCTNESIAGSLVQCAQLGLEPNSILATAYLVPFNNTKKGVLECQLIPGYRGLMELAYRTSKITCFEMRPVYKDDKFSYQYGSDGFIHHVQDADCDPNEDAIYWYAIAWIKDEARIRFEVRNRKQIEANRARSRAREAGPWVSDYNAMAMKTVARQLCKTLPSSAELMTAVALDEAADAGLDQHFDFEIPVAQTSESPESKSSIDKLADKLQQSNGKADEKTSAPKQEERDMTWLVSLEERLKSDNATLEDIDDIVKTLVTRKKAGDINAAEFEKLLKETNNRKIALVNAAKEK